jgi:D-alanine-D-alanine ligase
MQIALIRSITDKPWRSPETYQLIETSLGVRWQVHAIETRDPDELHSFLAELHEQHGQEFFVFNIAEYLDEAQKTGFLPGLLEAWDLPHLGSSAETVAIGLDKGRTKAALEASGIPTPAYFIAEKLGPALRDQAAAIGYPLIAKPNSEGGHIGVSNDSVVYDDAALEERVARILDEFDQPALVEAFVSGEGMREYSVGILEGETRLAVPMEIDFEAMPLDVDILSFEAAQNDLERTKLIEDEALRNQVTDLASRTFAAVGARDYCRVDLRADATDCYVLEINVMPGLGPHSFLPELAEQLHGLAYKDLIQRLAENSIKRQTAEREAGPPRR